MAKLAIIAVVTLLLIGANARRHGNRRSLHRRDQSRFNRGKYNRFIHPDHSNRYMKEIDPELKGYCTELEDGLYNHPSVCEKYVRCSNGNTIPMRCPSGMKFNPEAEKCDYPNNVNCLKIIGRTVYKTKDRGFGKITIPKGIFGSTGKILQIRLKHISGYVKCSVGSKPSNWGCNNLPPYKYTREIIGTLITDSQNEVIFEQSRIPGKDGMSDSIVFNVDKNKAKRISLPYELRVWYNEDYRSEMTSDNSGEHRVEVSVTMISEELEGYCKDKEDGLYSHPSMCERYVKCSSGKEYSMICRSGFQFNPETEKCDFSRNVVCLKRIGQTTYKTKGKGFGKITIPRQLIGSTGQILQIKLKHVSGFVKCSVGSKPSNWGCNNLPPYQCTREVIGTLITDSKNEVIFEQTRIPGKDGMSDYIVFNVDKNKAKQISLPFELRVWYNEDFYSSQTSDNSGEHTVDVFVTMISEELEGYCEDKEDGLYNHPSICEKYVRCSKGIPHAINCRPGMQFNVEIERCDDPRNVVCLRRIGQTTYKTKEKGFGKIMIPRDFIESTAKILQIRLKHVSGFVKCSVGSKPSYWGCNNLPPHKYTREIIGTLITDSQDEIIFEQSRIPGKDGMSDSIVFNVDKSKAKRLSLPYELRVWYNEDYHSQTTSDNSGEHTVEVSVTMISEELEGYCKHKEDGLYNHPSVCEKYVRCTNGKETLMKCRSNRQFNARTLSCGNPKYVRCLKHIGRTTYKTKGKGFGTVTIPRNVIGDNGILLQVKLQHVSGHVKCSVDSEPSYWGCNNLPPHKYTREIIGTLITDSENQVVFEQSRIPARDGMSQSIVFNVDKSNAKEISLPYKLHVWYNEDYRTSTTSDNSGEHTVDVFVTMIKQQKSTTDKGMFEKRLKYLLHRQLSIFEETAGQLKPKEVQLMIKTQRFALRNILRKMIEKRIPGLERILKKQIKVLVHKSVTIRWTKRVLNQQIDELRRALLQLKQRANLQMSSGDINAELITGFEEQLRRVIEKQIQEIMPLPDTQPQDLKGRLQQKRAELNKVLSNLRQKDEPILRIVIERLLKELRRRLSSEIPVVQKLIRQQINKLEEESNLLQQEVGITQYPIEERQRAIQKFEYQIENIKEILKHQSTTTRTEFLKRRLSSLEIQLQRIRRGSISPGQTENVVSRFCNERSIGLYSHPTSCERYIVCSNSINEIKTCDTGLLFDIHKKLCLPWREATCLKRIGHISYKLGTDESRSDSIVLSKENLEKVGRVQQLVIERINKPPCPPAICTPECFCQPRMPLRRTIQPDVTDQHKEVLFSQSKLRVTADKLREVVFFDKVKNSEISQTLEKLPIILQVSFNSIDKKHSLPVQQEEDIMPVYVTFVHDQQEPELEHFCDYKPDGNYNHPSICEKLVICSNKIPFSMDCPSGLQFDMASNKCLEPTETTCLQFVGEVTYGTKDESFGTVSLTKETIGKAGHLTQVKLEHVSGFVQCSVGSEPSVWGCNNLPPARYTKEIVGTVLTDDKKEELFYQERIPGYDGMSDFIVYNKQNKSAPMIDDLPYTLKIWYNEDYWNNTESDNSGEHTIKVYVTVVPLPKQISLDDDNEDSSHPELQGYCDHKEDGIYNHPSKCERYIQCSKKLVYSMPCPAGLHYDATRKFCDTPERARCLIFIGSTVFEPKGDNYGVVRLDEFNVQRTGKLIQVKLEHVLGAAKCSLASTPSYWRCDSKDQNSGTEEINTIITNRNDLILIKENEIPGYTDMSKFIVFNKDEETAPVIERLPYELRVWYEADWLDFSENDNSGKHYVNVYATVLGSTEY